MDRLLTLINNKHTVKGIENDLGLEWASETAIIQANNAYHVFGEPNYIKIGEGGVVRWFDVGASIIFHEVCVEDRVTINALRGIPRMGSYTINTRIDKMWKHLPRDLFAYNHAYGRLTCFSRDWKEALFMFGLVLGSDVDFVDYIGRYIDSWKEDDDLTSYIDILTDIITNEDTSADHESEEEEEEEEAETDVEEKTPIKRITPEAPEEQKPRESIHTPSSSGKRSGKMKRRKSVV